MAKAALRLVAPNTENRTVGPRRPKNADLRTREHLTHDEAELLIEAAKKNRHGQRDGLMVLLAYRHGLRAAEVVDLRGSRSTSKRLPCTSGASRTARLALILSPAVSCGYCGAISGKARAHRSSSCRNAAHRYRHPDSRG
jgi:integrase